RAGHTLLTRDNTYTGKTNLHGGTLTLGHDNALGGSTLHALGGVTDYADGVTLTNPIVLESALNQFQVTTGSATQAGAISETGGAELVLTGANSWTGDTTVRDGTMVIEGDSDQGAATYVVGWLAGDDGELIIRAGGTLANGYSKVGEGTGSVGAVTVTGTGSVWDMSDALSVGYRGDGFLTVEAGGRVSNGLAHVGSQFGSTGAVTVTGANSLWANSAELRVGYEGDGTLTVEAGGQVNNTYGLVGSQAGSVGVALVTGA